MANIKISELNELTKSQTAYDDFIPVVDTSANETKKISVENLTANNVYLLAVVKPNGQVPAPVAGAKYYNESTNKIYYALDDEHWYEYGTPVEGIFYVVLGEKGNYIYDAKNEILVSVGGGGGSSIVVEPDEPTEDTKLLIEEDDLDFQGLEISDEHTTGDNVAYSADYSNKAFGGTILWTNPNPTSNFAGQTIQISSTDYDILEIFYVTIQTSSGKQVKSVKTIKGYNALLDFYDGYSSKGGLRTVTISGNQITFSNSFFDSASGTQNCCVPLYIVGYKTGLFS